MILTGKAKEDFILWCENNSISYVEVLSVESYLNALIIEFFDSIKYSENTSLWEYCFSNAYWNRGMREYMESIEQAIKKANENYNKRS